MSVKSKPYYWIECDHVGCDDRSPSDGYEINAWSDEDGALSGADDDGWATTDTGEHYCPEHVDDEDAPDLSGLNEFTRGAS